MRFGISVENQKMLAEERRQSKRVLSPEAEGLAAIDSEEVDQVNIDDGTGEQMPAFTLGLHNPFDTNRPTWFPGT